MLQTWGQRTLGVGGRPHVQHTNPQLKQTHSTLSTARYFASRSTDLL